MEKYEGYAVDLIQKLSELMDFEYDFMIVGGNGKFNQITKEWDGIIRKLIDHVSIFIAGQEKTIQRSKLIFIASSNRYF